MSGGNGANPTCERIAELAIQFKLGKTVGERAVRLYSRSGEERDTDVFLGAALLIACYNTGYPMTLKRMAKLVDSTDWSINQAEKELYKKFTIKNMRFDCTCPLPSDTP